MSRTRCPRGLVAASFLSVALLAPAEVAGAAQQSGHSTLPTSGPAAPGAFPTARAAEDAVLARIERLRRELGDLAKLYKKATTKARAHPQRELDAGLQRAQAEVTGLLERLRSKDAAEPR